MRKIACHFILALGLLSVINSAVGQDRDTYSVAFQGVTLNEAIQEVLQLAPIDIVYSRELIAGKVVYCREKDASLDRVLRCMLEGTGIDYIRSSSGTYILMKATEIEPRFGNMGGAVFDAHTRAPLPFANVLIADGSSGTTTNEDGLFSIASLVAGRQPLAISYVGYKPVYDTVYIEAGNINRQEFFLEAEEIQIDPIVISGIVQRMPSAMLGAGERNKDVLQSIQGSKTADAIQGASQLVGISIQQPIADLHIQGGSGNEHLDAIGWGYYKESC